MIARHAPGSGTFRWTYDKAGRVVETRDPYNGVRQFRYDEADQLVAAMGGAGGTTRYEYDENGRAVRITDPMGGVTHRTCRARQSAYRPAPAQSHTRHKQSGQAQSPRLAEPAPGPQPPCR